GGFARIAGELPMLPPGRLPRLPFVPLALAGAWLAASSALAEGTGTIVGRVVDETGVALPGGTIEASAPASGARGAATDASGAYRIEALPAGTYRVSFRLINFVGVERRQLAVATGGTATADATMRLSVSADVVVTGKRTFRNLADVTEPGESLVGVASAS